MRLFAKAAFQSLLALLILCALLNAPLMARVVEFPQSGDIDMIIPFGPASDFNVLGRELVPYWNESLPGSAQIVPRNAVGAGGRNGFAQMYAAKPDGRTIGMLNVPGFVAAQVAFGAGSPTFRGSLMKVTWFGRATRRANLIMVTPKSGIESLEDLSKRKSVRVATTGRGSTSFLLGSLMANEFGFEPKFVIGSVGEIKAALLRGDAELICFTLGVFAANLDAGELKAIAQISTARDMLVPDVPTVGELGMLQELAPVGDFQPSYGGPPGMSDETAAIFEGTLLAAQSSPELEKKLLQGKRFSVPATSNVIRSAVDGLLDFFSARQDLIKRIYLAK